MNKLEKYKTFLESLKTEENKELIDVIIEGTDVCFSDESINEGFMSKVAGTAGLIGAMAGIGHGSTNHDTQQNNSDMKRSHQIQEKKIPKFSEEEAKTLVEHEIKSLVKNKYAAVSKDMQIAKDKLTYDHPNVKDVGVIQLDSGIYFAFASK